MLRTGAADGAIVLTMVPELTGVVDDGSAFELEGVLVGEFSITAGSTKEATLSFFRRFA